MTRNTATPNAERGHVPVMVAEMLEALAPHAGGLYVDGTFGAGGYSRAILAAAACQVIGIDRDADAIARGQALVAASSERFALVEGRFGELEQLLGERGIRAIDGVALDLGVSSPQIDTPERGFSFRHDGPLDMRMGQSGQSAADLVNHADEAELSAIFRELGEERRAGAVARAIIAHRATQPFSRTSELAGIVRTVVRPDASGNDPATRVFQALRMAVNDELGELERGLAAAERLLRPQGRLVVVSFHSIEDRCVKRFLKTRAKPAPGPSRYSPPLALEAPQPSFKLLHAHALRPSASECRDNPRARSARLRAAMRTEAPAWSERRAA